MGLGGVFRKKNKLTNKKFIASTFFKGISGRITLLFLSEQPFKDIEGVFDAFNIFRR